MKKPIIIFVVVSLLVILLFFLSNTKVFDVTIKDGQYTYPKQFSLKELFTSSKSFHLTIKGWLLLLITIIGLPALIAWRSTLTKYDRKTGKPKSSIWDKFKG
ncbi:MAG TPA: hypothetical protein EYG85_01110 [Crocinitomix sp.]|nr:hypothetical protein [Crocinitomix sp.]